MKSADSQPIAVRAGDIIRYVYKGEFEYARWNADNSRWLICSQRNIDEWRNSHPIKPFLYCDNQALQQASRLLKESLRDGKVYVIQGVWKGEQFHPKKVVKP